MRILALDASLSSTGYCVMDDAMDIICCGKITTKSKDLFSKRLNIICGECESLINDYKVDRVIVEGQYVHRNKNTAMKLSRLFGALIYMASSNDIDIYVVEPSKVRRILLGDGDSCKEEIASYVESYYKNNKLLSGVGAYSDKSNKDKTSDIYDSISIGMSYITGIGSEESFNRL